MVPGVRKGRAVSERRTFKTFILNFVSLSSLALGDNAQYIFHTRGKTFTSSIDGRKNVDMFRRRGKLFTASTWKNGVFFFSVTGKKTFTSSVCILRIQRENFTDRKQYVYAYRSLKEKRLRLCRQGGGASIFR